jgi:hypothetical protein
MKPCNINRVFTKKHTYGHIEIVTEKLTWRAMYIYVFILQLSITNFFFVSKYKTLQKKLQHVRLIDTTRCYSLLPSPSSLYTHERY